MSDTNVNNVLDTLCSLPDSLLARIIEDFTLCVAQTETAGRRSGEGLSPQAAMAAEDRKVQMHEVCGKARQYVRACKDMASYVVESGVLGDVEKDLDAHDTKELECFLTDLGEYLSQCLSRLKQFVATETKFREEVRPVRASISPSPHVQEKTSMYWPVGGFFVGAVALALLMRLARWETPYRMGRLLFVGATVSLGLLISLIRWGTPYMMGSLFVVGATALLMRLNRWGNPYTTDSLFLVEVTLSQALLMRLVRWGTPYIMGVFAVPETRAGHRWRDGTSLAPSQEVSAFCDTLERVHKNAEAMCGRYDAAKSCVDGWMRRDTAQRHSSEVDYEKIRVALQSLKSTMEKTLRDVNIYLK